MEFVLIPAGSFVMGTDCIPKATSNCNENETPIYKLSFSKAFYVSKYEVTQAQWYQIMRTSPAHFDASKVGGDSRNYPVESVSWQEVNEFIQKLNAKENVVQYRLPNEAEWEYAARGGSMTERHFGDDEGRLGEYAWFAGNSGNQTHAVGQKKPNDFGLYDMLGNVWEWTCSEYGSYEQRKQIECNQTVVGQRVVRGGSWNFEANNVRSALRLINDTTHRYFSLGFRLISSP